MLLWWRIEFSTVQGVAMTKINISLPAELLDRIDAEADVLGLTRSGLIQEASARYIVASEQDREAELRRLRAHAAARRMKAIGLEMGMTSPDTTALVHQARSAEEHRHES